GDGGDPVGVVARAETAVGSGAVGPGIYPRGRAAGAAGLFEQRRFAALGKQLDLPPVRLRHLRPGPASNAPAAGVDLKVIQHDIGHCSAVTTADTYVSVFRQVAAVAARASAELLLSHARIRLSLEGAAQA